jgi:flagellar FliL protein
MATAPKTAPKAGPKAVAAPGPEEAPKKSNKKLILIAVAALILLGGGGGGAAWYFMRGSSAPSAPAAAKVEPAKAPVFVVMEPFTVNLQSENGDQFLQITFTLQVADAVEEELLKSYMPQLRSRLLLLLSSKKASEISTVEGKNKLQDEIIATVNQPFAPNGKPQNVSHVFFTSFVIQ